MNTLVIGRNEMLLRAVAGAVKRTGHQVRVAIEGRAGHGGWLPGVEAVALRPGGPGLPELAAGFEAVILFDPSVAESPAGSASASADVPVPTAADVLALPAISRVLFVTARDNGDNGDNGAPATVDSGEAGHVASGKARQRNTDGRQLKTEPRPSTGEARQVKQGKPDARLTTIRTSPVYGTGEDFVTLFLIMMRSLPVVPVLGESHAVRPVWIEDVAAAVAAVLFAPPGSILEPIDLDGPDLVTQDQLYDHIAALVDRQPVRVPVPDFLAGYGARLAEGLRRNVPLEASHLAFVRASTDPERPRSDALERVAGIRPTPLDDGLRRLIRGLPELTPGEGIGGVDVKRFIVRITGGRLDPPALMRAFRERFYDMMPVPIGVESVAPVKTLDKGAVLTMALPGRGHVAVRVQDVADDRVVLSTLRGHALAGFIQFRARAGTGGAVEFEVMACDAAANAMDWLSLTLGGARLQDANWTRLLHNVATLSGGEAAPVESDARKLSTEEAAAADRWIREIIDRRQTTSSPAPKA